MAVIGDIVGTALDLAVSKVSQKVGDLTDRLDGAAGDTIEDAAEAVTDEIPDIGGATGTAAVGAASAGLTGKNPVWGAIKGAWSGGSAKVKAAIVAAVVALVLLLVLSPVLLLLLLITVLIVIAVAKAKQS